MCRRLAAKIVGSDNTYRPTVTYDRKQRREAKKRSKQLDQALRADWKHERSRIKLLLLGKYYICIYISVIRCQTLNIRWIRWKKYLLEKQIIHLLMCPYWLFWSDLYWANNWLINEKNDSAFVIFYGRAWAYYLKGPLATILHT